MASIVYILCAILSFSCFFLLFRAYRETKTRMTLWSSLGFLGFFFNNALLLMDSSIGPNYDLSIERTVPAFIGITLLLYGLITETVGE